MVLPACLSLLSWSLPLTSLPLPPCTKSFSLEYGKEDAEGLFIVDRRCDRGGEGEIRIRTGTSDLAFFTLDHLPWTVTVSRQPVCMALFPLPTTSRHTSPPCLLRRIVADDFSSGLPSVTPQFFILRAGGSPEEAESWKVS